VGPVPGPEGDGLEQRFAEACRLALESQTSV